MYNTSWYYHKKNEYNTIKRDTYLNNFKNILIILRRFSKIIFINKTKIPKRF